MSMIFTSRQDVERYMINSKSFRNFADCIFIDCDLHGFDFNYANFRGAHIINCNFEGAVLTNSVFDDASITGSNFNYTTAEPCGASFCGASFCAATLANVSMNDCSLSIASFIEATLKHVSIKQSSLIKACFNRAYVSDSILQGSDLSQAKFVDAKIYHCVFTGSRVSDINMIGAQMECPDGLDACEGFNAECISFACPAEGSFVAWKACRDNTICKILIPEDAKRSSAFGRKCRASKFKVLEIYHVDLDTNVIGVTDREFATSMFNPDWIYERGKTYEEPNFVNDRFKECTVGLHFFMNKQDAIDYAR